MLRAGGPREQLEHYVAQVLCDTDAFYTPEPTHRI